MASTDRIRQASSPRNVLVILAGIWIGLLLYNALGQLSGLLTVHGYRTDFLNDQVYLTVKIWLPWVVVSPLLVWLARRFPIEPGNWVRLIGLHLLFLLGLSLITGSALSFSYHYLEEMSEMMKSYQPWQHIGHYLFGDQVFLYNAIIYTVFIAAFNIQNFYARSVQRERDSARLAGQLHEARLRALQMQVNPHFLFNTLNGISVLVMKGENDRAAEMIRRLGDFFRSTLEDSGAHWVPLARELETVGQYLAIEQVRFEDRLAVRESFDPQAMAIEVPSMILQPLVENAMQHGIGNRDGPCELRLESGLRDRRLHLAVRDNGAGCRFDGPEFVEGIGLRNVRQRLRQSYGEDFVLALDGEPGRGAAVLLDLPLTGSRSEAGPC